MKLDTTEMFPVRKNQTEYPVSNTLKFVAIEWKASGISLVYVVPQFGDSVTLCECTSFDDADWIAQCQASNLRQAADSYTGVRIR